MARKTIETKEIRFEKLKTKEIFHCLGNGFEVVSREVFRNGSEIHHPFDVRNGSQKYKFITSIVFDHVSPSAIHGVYKAWNRGLGFTRYLSPIIEFLQTYPKITTVRIAKKKHSKLKADQIVFSVEDIETLYQRIRPFRNQQSEELKDLTTNLFASIFPSAVKGTSPRYYPGELTRLVETKSVKGKQLSPNDIESLSSLLAELPAEHRFITEGKFIATKEKFEIVSIEATLKYYRRLLARKINSKHLEESWHQFFKNHSWLLSQMFASPMVIFGDKAYVGGKDLANQKGKIADFIYRNSFSRSAAIIEIKTHRTPLLANRAYRDPDVFSISKELSGAINQVLDQKDTLQKDYNSVTKGAAVESFNPGCVVLVGQLSDLKSDRTKSLELFRNNSKDVVIVTFDELLKRIETILEIFRNKPQKRAKRKRPHEIKPLIDRQT